MAYTTPVQTEAEGGHLTAAEVNTYIVANFAAMVPDIFTAKGDIAVATAADAASPLAVGSDNYSLAANSAEDTGLEWVTPVGIRVYHKKLSLLDASWAQVPFETFESDPYSLYASGTSRFTAPTTGYYLCSVAGFVAGSVAEGDVGFIAFYVNGVLYSKLTRYQQDTAASGAVSMAGCDIVAMTAAQYLETYAYTTGAAGSNYCYLTLTVARLDW